MKTFSLSRWVMRLGLVAVCLSAEAMGVAPVYLNEAKPLDKRIEDALSRMTLEEKVAMCHGAGKFCSAGVPRLGIPELWMSDGPHGVRAEVNWANWSPAGWTTDYCTAFPALTCLAATFDPEMAYLYGKSIGEEARYRKKEILLGPGVNIYRTPLNGRNFEYMGEDPYLAGSMVVPYIKGVQENGVAACVKHFALNNQEHHRDSIDVNLSDRALHEIYLPAFKAAVQKGNVWSVMGAYNRFRGHHCCESTDLLNGILKDDWKFDGVVVSDWGATHDTKAAVEGGLDIEMGTDKNEKDFLADAFLDSLKKGEISESVVDDKVRRILRLNMRTAMDTKRPWGSFATQEHFDAARKIAEAGIVLLKNDKGALPLNVKKGGTIVVIGENATRQMCLGGGSSELKTKREVSPLDGIKAHFGMEANVVYAEGYSSDKKKDASRLYEAAVTAAGAADAVIFVGGLNKNGGQDCEGADRTEYGLPYGQNELIEALSKANEKLVVVLISGNAVEMPWVGQAPAIVQSWYLGSEAGNALANVLSGEVNPSGKLPFTFPEKLADNASSSFGSESYPGKDGKQEYKEDILVGYRWHDTKGIKPLFPFGHGLSYTTFEFGPLKANKQIYESGEKVNVTFRLKNTGQKAGGEVAQLYVKDMHSSVMRPEKELKVFVKVFLNPGEERSVTMTLLPEDFSFYDDKTKSWKTEPGEFLLKLGNSSGNIVKEVAVIKK